VALKVTLAWRSFVLTELSEERGPLLLDALAPTQVPSSLLRTLVKQILSSFPGKLSPREEGRYGRECQAELIHQKLCEVERKKRERNLRQR
jgi:hypothetical protein